VIAEYGPDDDLTAVIAKVARRATQAAVAGESRHW
jgi:hypothetical protein